MGVKVTSNSQSVGADVNEIFFGYYLTNSWDDFKDSDKVQTELDERSNRLDDDEVKNQKERAKVMAKVTLEWMENNGYDGNIVKKWWPKQNSGMISQAIGYEIDLDKNPLDILVQTDKGKFLGLSAKSTKGSGKPPFKNPGLGTIELTLGLKLKHHYDDAVKEMLKEFPELPKINSERKIIFKSDTEFYEKNIQGSKFVQHVFEGIRDDMYDKLITLSQEELWDYVKDYWMDAGFLQPPYIIVTGRGTDGKYAADINDRDELSGENLTLQKIGCDKIRIFSKGEKLLDMRVKFESQHMATSIKFSGE
ncbi:MAG: hypothetical protein HOD60_10860 [Candidatus Nitrosopelagicus sp.]|jgi:hypothetical protein|nr:hypothetical protein [Candidatus Nitrosopelagicus sp.]